MTDIEIPLGKRSVFYRLFEMLPALLSYSLILIPIIMSIVNPFIAAIFIVGYDTMWFVKAVAIAYRMTQGFNVMRRAQLVDWLQRLHDLDDVDKTIENLKNQKSTKWQINTHYNNLLKVAANKSLYYKPNDVFNAVIIPFYSEGFDVLDPTVKSILDSHYDRKNIILILAYEERGGEPASELANALVEKYGNNFYHMEAVMHPKDIKYEVIGKGGNITFAGRHLQNFLKKKNIDPDKVIVTTFDADNRPHPSYLACVTYEYILIGPEHIKRAFQPISIYMSNIWDVPAPMRVLATGNSFWNIINSVRPHMLRNFSSHSQGMSSLIATDFWSVRTIVEDGHQYWRSYFTFDGDYDVVPIYLPVYQDAVLSETYYKTIKAQFIQLRRWAYGASDIAYVAEKGFHSKNKMPKLPLLGRFLRLIEGHVSWASASIIVTFGAWAPLFLNHEAQHSIVANELPFVASQLQLFATGGLFLVIFLSMRMLPPRPRRYRRHRHLFMLLQWAIMPVVSICYGSVSAFNAQTRLLFGRYLDKFDLTVKVVKK
ncbi:MAG TPA: glycosyltransferase family 2 protein [Patescibacteria group bacterium]|jgi:cellulose synthase/poly-beta-1,6-N-acetylglucosamine synthase-like glycosyltransferase|nr:glycosyltransferase family 2 protein [Patescibacteria group bacterium]